MHKSTSPKRNSFKLYATLSTALLAVGAVAALLAGITPASAASLAQKADTQVYVFMVPLTLLVLVLMIEVARLAWRGSLPVEATPRRPSRLHWKPGNGEG